MEQNPYESPKYAAGPREPRAVGSLAIWCWSFVMSFFAVTISGIAAGVLSTKFRPETGIGDWIVLPIWGAFSTIGLAYVWYSHWAVVNDPQMRR